MRKDKKKTTSVAPQTEICPSTAETAVKEKKLRSDFQYLRHKLFQWMIQNNNHSDISERGILLKYLNYYREYYEYDRFSAQFEMLPSLEVNLNRVASIEMLYKSFNLFQKAEWEIRLSNRFLGRLTNLSLNYIMCILGHIMHVSEGRFKEMKALNNRNIPNNKAYLYKIAKGKNLLIQVGVEKVPILKNSVIKRYQFNSYLGVMEMLNEEEIEHVRIADRLKVIVSNLQADVVTCDHSDELDQVDVIKTEKYLFKVSENPDTGRIEVKENSMTPDHASPMKFKAKYMGVIDNNSIIFDKESHRWMSKEYVNEQQRRKANEYQRRANQEMLKGFVDFQSAQRLVELLCQIPNFKIRLTKQEEQVIGQNGNVLVIGRSGTGKTTCAILRLFAIEMLFKIRLSLFRKKYWPDVKACGADDIDKTLGLRCVFLTASPVLTHEVQRYYLKLTDNIKRQLENKRQRLLKEQKQQKQQMEQMEQMEQIEQMKQKQQMEQMEQKEQKEAQCNTQQLQTEEMPHNNSIRDTYEESGEVLVQQQKGIMGVEEQREMEEAPELREAKSKKEEEEKREEEYKEMSKELSGIEMEEKEEEEEDLDNLKEKFEDKMRRFHSLEDLSAEDYPGFFTVRSFIQMVDGSLPRPFFIRTKQHLQDQSKAAWHNEKKGVMFIENYYRREEQRTAAQVVDEEEFEFSDEEELEHEYRRQLELKEQQSKQTLTKKLQEKKGLSFEVDFEYFELHFWPEVRSQYYSRRKITAQLVWTEIYSTIKGSAGAHLFPAKFLFEQAYREQCANPFLTTEEKKDIYEAFCQYEQWKSRVGAYDILDAVNYILNKLQVNPDCVPQLHYVMIDEVQDLPHAMVYLLSKVATSGVFYSGDTAQTIAKGVGFRFCDLRNLFNSRLFEGSLSLAAPHVKQLTVNFRSHNDILQMANSVVSTIEILFPKTIDRMKKEVSDLKGNKPIILGEKDLEMLFYVLSGDRQDHSPHKLEFGCDQVIIVRDQPSKAKVPSILQHALCLTIYEAKGLEFNDVILYNFFAESTCADKWNLLKMLHVSQVQINKQDYEQTITRHKHHAPTEDHENNKEKAKEEEEEEEEEVVDFEMEEKEDVCLVRRITAKSSAVKRDVNDYAQVCSELKQLYTAITRARKNLIIYDEEASARKNMERLWSELGVTQYAADKQADVVSNVLRKTSGLEWRKQGLRMYSWGYFEQAIKCFEQADDPVLLLKSQANHLANTATQTLLSLQAARPPHPTKHQKTQPRKKEKEAHQLFVSAADKFNALNMAKQAGQCYFSGKAYRKAMVCFEKNRMWKQAAECVEMMGEYEAAAEIYEKAGEYLKVIECLDMNNLWTKILDKIQLLSAVIQPSEKKLLIKKYAPLALSELVYQIEFENDIQHPEDNQVIHEKLSDEEEESEEDEQIKQPKQKTIVKQQSIFKQEQIIDQKVILQQDPLLFTQKQQSVNKQQKSIEVNSSNTPKQQQIQIKEQIKQHIKQLQSFEDIQDDFIVKDVQQLEKKISKQVSQGQKLDDSAEPQRLDESGGALEIKNNKRGDKSENSEVEFLEKSESSFSDLEQSHEPEQDAIRSLIDPQDLWVRNSVSDIPLRLESEYSALESASFTTGRIIKTKGNIMIQDEIMRKIVHIVSVVHDQSEFLKQFKGYQSLLTQTNSLKPEAMQVSDFEDFEPGFIDTILDTLESFKLFKLCLFVCNRYNLAKKAGRYLTSVAVKYSPNCAENQTLNPGVLSSSLFRKGMLEKGILASVAIHAVLENVNADFLKIENLGMYFAEALILQGMYKKVVFMLEKKDALQVLSNYGEFEAYRDTYPSKEFFLETAPKTEEEINYTTVMLRRYWMNYARQSKLLTLAPRYIKELHQTIEEKKPPHYLQFSAGVFPLEELIPESYNILRNGQPHEIIDLVAYLTAYLYQKETEVLSPTLFLQLYRTLTYIETMLQKMTSPHMKEILEGMGALYLCTPISLCEPMRFLAHCSFVHRGSILINEFIGKNKFCYFFEQNYDWLIVQTTDVLSILHKKWQIGFTKLCHRRYHSHFPFPSNAFEKHTISNEEKILKIALKGIVDKVQKKVKKNFQESNQKYEHFYSRNPKNRLDGNMKRMTIYSSDEEQQAENKYRQIILEPTFNMSFEVLTPIFVDLFNKEPKQPVKSSQNMFCCNQNIIYREYAEKNKVESYFYNAMEYKKFKRIDLYAENIIPIIGDFGYEREQLYIQQILTLGLIQLLLSEKREFSLLTPKSLSKYLEGLKEESNECYAYLHPYVSEMSMEDNLVYLLQLLEQCGVSKVADFRAVVSFYILNVPHKSKLTTVILRIINDCPFKSELCSFIKGCKDSQEFSKKRTLALENEIEKTLKVIVSFETNIQQVIEASERDYEQQTREIQIRKIAARKIEKWWCLLRRSKEKTYFEHAMGGDQKKKTSTDYRIMDYREEKSRNAKVDITVVPSFFAGLVRAERELLSFFLGRYVTNALDFHFILITLNQIAETKKAYFAACAKEEGESKEGEIHALVMLAEGICTKIDIWRKDEKWLKEEHLILKKKKLFELKWINKNFVSTSNTFQKILKKRAGAKRQIQLQQKKNLLRRIANQ